jgi:hypothetical protein
VNGLLCCGAPGYGPHHDLNMTLLDEQQQQQQQMAATAEWRGPPAAMDKVAAEMLMDKTASLDKMAAAVSSNWREDRTVEWVMESQRMMMMAACRAGNGGHRGVTAAAAAAAAGYCGQDCGDGFCYNVWNSMVPV